MNGLRVLKIWDASADWEKDVYAKHILEHLPEGFDLIRFDHFQHANGKRTIAVFEYQGKSFSFVPGGTVTLGFEDSQMNAQEILDQSLRDARPDETARATEEGMAFLEEMSRQTSGRRTVTLPAMLVEQKAFNVGMRRVEEKDHPAEVVERLSELAPLNDVLYSPWGLEQFLKTEGREFKIQMTKQGLRVYEVLDRTAEDVELGFAASGFSLMTEDQWEWAASGGVDTLFRWGNQIPDPQSKFEMAPGQDDLEPYVKPELKIPNAFGLWIGQDPYSPEFCSDGRFLKGGDGGNAWCGGQDHLRIWQSLMVPFRHKVDRPLSYPLARRCLVLDF